MSIELLRVDPASRIPIGEDWSGFALREQRFPVSGTGWQLWSMTRVDPDSPTATILSGMPITAAWPTAEELARRIENTSASTAHPISAADALIWLERIGFAKTASLVEGRWIPGIAGSIALHRYYQSLQG
jgi:hypothetical protein